MSERIYTTEMPAVRGKKIIGGVKSGNITLLEHWAVKGKLPDGRVFVITIEPGFEFDGASIPRFLWRLCGHPQECPRLAAALAHDWLYRAHVCSRKDADLIYRAICRQVGLAEFPVAVEYKTLDWFGRKAWKSWTADNQYAARKIGRLRWR
ncbi:MAG: DUF1353 domain-containing protein [Kiritimatiellae bacterium]|nr:DUF1353 domain-containing protein [Kiritimatiellia bacterium]